MNGDMKLASTSAPPTQPEGRSVVGRSRLVTLEFAPKGSRQ